ncbi:MAG: MBL fold metallo-hydrolase [Luteolibacter sp.]
MAADYFQNEAAGNGGDHGHGVEVSLTFLGTGTSVGVPVIGCDCRVCRSENPKNKRLRSSVLVRAGATTVLVDSGTDLRAQALREGLREVDAVIYTHAHLDHVAGFDELRAFCWRRSSPLPMHATASCMETLKKMFGWAFEPDNVHKGYIKPGPCVIDGEFRIGGLTITPLPVEHGSLETIGFLFRHPGAKSAAYLPDVKRIPDATLKLLGGVDVLVIDALRSSPHPTHFCVADAMEAAEACGAGETWLTHLGHENDHAELEKSLPETVRVAWDGLKLPLAGLA